MFVRRLVGFALVCAMGIAGCGSQSNEEESTAEVEIAPAASRAGGEASSAPAAAPGDPAPAAQSANAALLAPTPDERAPDRFRVALDTTEGTIEIDCHRDWSPHGADRFYTLVKRGYFSDVAFFRVISGFMAQGGMHGDPQVNAAWRSRTIPDDPVVQSNRRGRVTFAKSGMPNSRSNQFFINFVDNTNLDAMGFSPFGEVVDMAVVDRLHSGYGEGAPRGAGPDQGTIGARGNAYLRESFPELDYIRSARIVE